jgi:cytochrome c biogenesis protein CcdA
LGNEKNLNKIKNTARAILLKVQKFFLSLGLFLLYAIGFGLTFLLVLLFSRSVLKENAWNAGTYWREAIHYTETLEEASRQS